MEKRLPNNWSETKFTNLINLIYNYLTIYK